MSGQRGSIRQRGRTHTAYYFVEWGGKRVQRSKGGFRTKGEARAFLNETLRDVQKGVHVEPRKITLERYLSDEWLPTLNKQRENTRASYRMIVDKWIVPAIGSVPLNQLTAKHVQTLIDRLGASGGRDEAPLSPRSVQYAYVVLKAALTSAVRRGFILRNPADAIDRPNGSAPEMQAWTAEEAGRFLASVAEDRLRAAWHLFLARGFRRGELAGLRWPDVDLDGATGRVHVRHTRVSVEGRAATSTPKTRRGTRTVPLDAGLVALLRAHRKQQIAEAEAWGEAWEGSDLYVFTDERGRPYHPQYLSKRFDKLVTRAGLRPIRLHDTRHTCATLAQEAGVPLLVVSQWLGHASVSITADIYSHVVPSLMEEAGATVTALLARNVDKALTTTVRGGSAHVSASL